MSAVSLQDIQAAHARIGDRIHKTPVLTSQSLNEIAGAQLFFKCENLQKTGAFKYRGATNAVLSLSDDEARRGVVTHSSGNHAQALALAAKMRGIPAHIVMPRTAPAAKIAAVEGYGGHITFCDDSIESREKASARVFAETGGVLIHPFNDERIIAGQGTAALELVTDYPDLDAVLAPVSGGGLLSGTALAAKGSNPKISVYGCEPKNADDAHQSLHSGELVFLDSPDTMADGLRASLGDKTFAIIRRQVDEIFLVTEDEIVQAMRYLWERMKMVVEPSGAVPFAACLNARDYLQGKRVGIILSGGNVDLAHLPF